jgi:stearoyl-CoA desaturase (delta-9 desaturase)
MSSAPSSVRQTYFNARALPFWGVHVAAIVGVVALGWSWAGLALAVGSYVVRMFFVTAGYHRYFSHRSFKTSRWFQLVLAFFAQTALQRGVLWWAGNHRHHHRHADTPEDIHSPRRGFWWSHLGWNTASAADATKLGEVRDLARFPELRALDRLKHLPALVLAVALFAIGGSHALVWGFLVSTVLLWHGTFAINSLAHVIGNRRYDTGDDSRNHWALALVTLGEGWHNNHHHYMTSARQGFYWWEVDVTYYLLRALQAVGLIWDVRQPSARALADRRAPTGHTLPATPPASVLATCRAERQGAL